MTLEPSSFPSQTSVDAAEAQLQQELCAMFELDTQQHFQAYVEVVQRLDAQSWTADIQHIYRAVHTVKGGAVTVEAEAVLRAATVLEDLLSDLRYLDQAPPLEDGQLVRMLQEAGELLSSTLEVKGTGEDAIASIQPTLDRIQALHAQIKQRYIPDWNELTQVHQEFAEQGFDLVILDLEMAVNQLPVQGQISDAALQIAQQTLAQLTQIGDDLQLAEDWTALVNRSHELAQHPDSAVWKYVWPLYFAALKDCAKHSGHYALEQLADLSVMAANLPAVASLETPAASEAEIELVSSDVDLIADFPDDLTDIDLPDLELSSLDETLFAESDAGLGGTLSDDVFSTAFTDDLGAEDLDLAALEEDEAAIHQLVDADPEDPELTFDSGDVQGLFPTPVAEAGLFPTTLAPANVPAKADAPESSVTAEGADAELRRRIKIPVPLERLDQSAQQVVETLLTTRSTLTVSQSLEFQVSQLAALTQESSQYITRLRQLQDDYALLRSLSHEQDPTNGTSVEQYRQGYTTINRLLENILRMSELSREIEGMSHQAVAGMGQLDRDMLCLKDEIESSRLVPFKNLTLRAKAIVRDLSNRYDKPAQLVIHGEQLELDAGVIQQIEPALLHLLRNAYDHGLESVEERMGKGKPVEGVIQLVLQRRGNLYRLTIQDDGRGIDAAAIHQKAQEKGFPLTETQTSADLLAVLCQPGFSSRNVADDVSGRGVGMDVVAGQIANMGGRLSLNSRPGEGSTFTIEVPAPQLLVPCVLLQVGKRTVAIPTEEIRETVLASSIQVRANAEPDALCPWTVETARGEAPGFGLAAYWQQSQTELSETAVCLRIRQNFDRLSDGSEMWLIADELLGQEALLINPIPSPLVVPAGLLGVSLRSDGRLISVIDPIALIEAIETETQTQPKIQPQQPIVPAAQPEDSTAPTLLIVDDAALMRRRLEGSLRTYGFVIQACVDGLEALQWLQSHPAPALLITDIEMPNMDGFTLVDRCRAQGLEMPILVISSRISEEWGREAQRLGANAYLNKGFATPELLQQVNQLLEAKQPQAIS
ncbi:Gliding motility regulatory protein [Acaryochloris thomasi RCC1774]|uniref:histidine kinase n=1 Tax=Acaryochloris thomasi RCC1774 TaxID=1764569 RepID=A0A2W1K1X9_9CYAN|nr:response regulator [Acaryochloris thomasi]PZD74451.1 Gliding motility regulatory protein [Acaryochloris thomasi RCC1774]